MADDKMVGFVFSECANALLALDTDEERKRVVRALYIAHFGLDEPPRPPQKRGEAPVAPAPVKKDLRRKYPEPGLSAMAYQAGVSINTMRSALTDVRGPNSTARRRALRYLKGLGLR